MYRIHTFYHYYIKRIINWLPFKRHFNSSPCEEEAQLLLIITDKVIDLQQIRHSFPHNLLVILMEIYLNT